MPWLPCRGCSGDSAHSVWDAGVTAAGQAEGRGGLQRRYPGDANDDGREVPLTPPAMSLCLGSPGSPGLP